MICLAMYGYRVTWHQLFVTYGDCKIEQVKDSCIVWWSYVSGIDLCRVIQGLWNNNYLMFGVVANKEGNGKTLYIYTYAYNTNAGLCLSRHKYIRTHVYVCWVQHTRVEGKNPPYDGIFHVYGYFFVIFMGGRAHECWNMRSLVNMEYYR